MKKKKIGCKMGMLVMVAFCVAFAGCKKDSQEKKESQKVEETEVVVVQEGDSGFPVIGEDGYVVLNGGFDAEHIRGKKNGTIWVVGDSIAAANPKNTKSEGWGTPLQYYVKDNVKVKNYAVNGASSSSYRTNYMYTSLFDQLKKGDYVVIQFGHNDAWFEDKYTDPIASSEEEGSFRNILKEDYIKPILEKGAYPILATSVPAVYFGEDGRVSYPVYFTHVIGMTNLAAECQEEGLEVALINTYDTIEKLYNEIGEKEVWKYHSDEIHYSNYGATYAAGVIAEEMKKLGFACSQDLNTFEYALEKME